eukprot:Plantae.Rhodophyta-Rhodochaete_pulchella.ctg712.p1 GENE.Plantae.Rhodophyta-Rhodochaete_pulchella.ctg712~~Plantae.Rhodophyta-Rhodochaete_pulchella.ctg712.p1  ORF type:complete len:331 (-),score=35.23 Plantae.Rhodophyta-Rhodochaete_pulchella.ctg712:451-1443(-)
MNAVEQDRLFGLKAWVPEFRGHTPAMRFVPVTRSVAEFLLSDGVWLSGTARQAQDAVVERQRERDPDYVESEEDDDGSGSDLNTDTPCPPALQEFESLIDAAVTELGGEVSPKLGPVCPDDACWVTFTRSTQCRTVDDVLTLVQSSDRVAENLSQLVASAGNGEEPVTYLALRRWSRINPGMEFRCFVRERNLIAICQRHVDQHHAFLEAECDSVRTAIEEYYSAGVSDICNSLFADTQDYVIDVYVDRQRKVWVLDLGPMSAPTDPLLYTWSELDALEHVRGETELRFVGADSAIRPSSKSCALPFELQGREGVTAVAEAARHLSGLED